VRASDPRAVGARRARDGDWFGFRLAVGRFDGDEVDDLAVSAMYDDTTGPEAGAVYVLSGARP
jgi:hypothetical protein